MTPDGALLWRCRRGTKELDVLLERYIRHAYPQATPAERTAFDQILNLPDPLLAHYLFGRATPDQPDLARLIQSIALYRP